MVSFSAFSGSGWTANHVDLLVHKIRASALRFSYARRFRLWHEVRT